MILLLLPMCALAQKKGAEDVVYLKNHFGVTEVHGTLIPEKDSNEIAVRTWDKNVWVFSRSDIDSIGREKLIFPSERNGWYNATSVAMYFGEAKGYQIQSVVGYRFLYRYYVGLGAAIDNYTIRSLPVFVDFQANWFLTKTTPFTYIDAGLSNPWPGDNEINKYMGNLDKKIPGTYLNFGIGQRIYCLHNNHSWEFSVGYSLETMKLRYVQNYTSYDPANPTQQITNPYVQTIQYTFNRLVLRVGFTL
ncbi:MAG: hypothetical protein ACRDE2_13970 [Chitinophagaceae bacterium]